MGRDDKSIDRSRLRTVPARRRPSKVKVAEEAKPHVPGGDFASFLASLPDVLAGAELRTAIVAWAGAWRRRRTVLFGFGAHLIKVGLSPLVVDLIEKGAITALATHGASCVHDLELALMGRTSEDVARSLDDGSFGMARETADLLNAAIARGAAAGLGMGEAVGREILGGAYPHAARSIFAAAVRAGVPITVHSAIGTDIHHMHASADGAALGATSYRDFEALAAVVAGLEGGVYLNVGSAVILPEVFLKALAIARNLGHRVDRFTTIDCDFARRYRTDVNVVDRPTRRGGRGIALIGHHEILVPLLAAAIAQRRARGPTAE